MNKLQWNRYIENAEAARKLMILICPISIFLKKRNRYIDISIIIGFKYPYGDDFTPINSSSKLKRTIPNPNPKYNNKSYFALSVNIFKIVFHI